MAHPPTGPLQRVVDLGRDQTLRLIAAVRRNVARWREQTKSADPKPQTSVAVARRAKIAHWARTGISKWEREGLLGALASAFRKLTRHYSRPAIDYTDWIATHEPGPQELERQRTANLPCRPLISLVLPVADSPLTFLKAIVESVLAQTYGHWELCLVDGGSLDPVLRNLLDGWVAQDQRIKRRQLPTDWGTADNCNSALAQATGDFVLFLDTGGTLAPFALYALAQAMQTHPQADCLYGDEDQFDATTGTRSDPYFKPAWAPDLLRSCNYIGRPVAFRRSELNAVGGLRPEFVDAHDYDLLLRLTERSQRIVHVPQVLFHRRKPLGDPAHEFEPRIVGHESARRALTEHLMRIERRGTVRQGTAPGFFHVHYDLPRRPLVSIVIPNRDQVEMLQRCLRSLWLTDYEHLEIVIVENGSRDPRTFAYYAQLLPIPNVRVVEFTGKFNYAAVINLGVREAAGEVIVQLNNDTQAINADWLERMLEHALRPEVGAVGAKLYFPDNGRIQHAGAVIGLGGIAGHAHIDEPRESSGYAGRLVTIQNCS
ncbi:MAG: glycosyltransferase, partial [Planctomycetes bacterium]|nr:glycosyltransferase [Planctomycetota bacterium]